MRYDFEIIANWVKPNSQVLDLGCGDGELLAYLGEKHKTWGVGLEIDDGNILRCIERNVNVIQLDLNSKLEGYFSERSFDYVIITQAIQAMHRPVQILDEILRIGKVAIVTFPNMGYWRCRAQLAMGKMPVTRALPHAWHSTGNTHLCTIADFETLCHEKGIHINQRVSLDGEGKRHCLSNFMPNLFAEMAIYLLSSEENSSSRLAKTEGRSSRENESGDEKTNPQLQLAFAVLLIDICRADFVAKKEEFDEIKKRFALRFNLPDTESEFLIKKAMVEHSDSTSLHDHLQLINQNSTMQEKVVLVEDLWAVAYADKSIDPNEEARIRTLTQVLKIPNIYFARGKDRVKKTL